MRLLRVADLLSWANGKGTTLPASPPVDGYEYVQIEALLCAIERQATENLSLEMAVEMVEEDPALSSYPPFARRPAGEGFDPTMCRWLIGATAHRHWRELFEAAVRAGELQMLDFASKLPIPGVAPVVEGEVQTLVGAEAVNQRQTERLRMLRAMGGDCTKKKGKWSTSGITELVKKLKEAGQKPSDEKSVRKDLIAAAEREKNPYVNGLAGR